MNITLNPYSEITVNDRLDISDGPSFINPCLVYWTNKQDQTHREDGPAVIYFKEYDIAYYPRGRFFLNGREFTEEEFYKKTKLSTE